MALPKSRNKKVSSTIKTSHKLIISGLLAFIFTFQIRLYKLDESYTPKPISFKLSTSKLTSISDSTTQLDAIQTINVGSSSMDKQRSSNGTIPKLLWMFWDKGLDHLQSLSQDPKNKYAVDYQCVQSMMKLNSNTWDVKLLDESGAKSLAPIYASLLNNDTFYHKMTPTMKGDVLRLELLSRYGGVYADTSICAFAELDSFITDWVGTDKDGFWAAPKDIAKKNSSKLQSLHVDKCHDLSLLPAKRQGSKNKGAPSRTTSNWFLASTNPHNPLVDEWLRVYVNHLLTLADPTQPYFLAHCSLSQARMNNATVERIWSATTKRIQRLGKTNSSYKSKCIKGGVSSCSTIVKRPNRDYVLSGKYAHDVFGTPYHPKLKGNDSTTDAAASTTQSIDHLHAVIHMGIHKTGTTTIQSQAKQLKHLLKLDGYEQPNGAGEQLHTRFATCFMDWKKKQREKKSEQCNIYTDDSFCMGGQACKPSMVEYGKDIASRGRNLFVSAESMADMSNEDMSRLSQYLKPWKKVTIVVFYRRYYDWLSSLYNQITKTRKLKNSQLWESSIVDFIESNVDHVRPIYTTELLNRIKEDSTFDNVVVMNYHDGGSTDKRGSDYALFCNEALNMTHTCDGLKAQSSTKQLNSGDHMEYLDLAFAASRADMIEINNDSKMKQVAQAFFKHHKDTLNGTTFERICPSADVLDKLWNMTVAFENELFPDSAVDQTLEEMRRDFNEASQAKLCKIDVDETLKDLLWLDFIETLESSITQQYTESGIPHLDEMQSNHNLSLSYRHQRKFFSIKDDVISYVLKNKNMTHYFHGDDKGGHLFAFLLNNEYAFRHIFKNGGTTIAWQTGVGKGGHVPRKKIGNRRLVTVVRDPIDHFLSGWSECGFRETLTDQQETDNTTTYDERIQSWLKVVKGRRKSVGCRPHSYPQANFLLDTDGRNTYESLDLIGDLRELPQVLGLAGFEYNYSIPKERNSSENEVKEKLYPKRVDLISDDTMKQLCRYLALDYYFFAFEPPMVCREDTTVLPLLNMFKLQDELSKEVPSSETTRGTLDAAGWNAMAKIQKFKQWGLQHTKVLKSIALPLWLDAPKDASDDDRMGDIWLPPRLQIDDEIRTLEYGVLFCAIGNIGFAKTQVVQMIRHLHENLGIPDAQGRAALREKGVHLKSRQGFALVTTRQFVEGPLKDWVSFFDAIYLAEDLPAYPFDWQSMTDSDAIIKATKVHVMASSPFDTTIMMDLDSFPCQHDFALPLLAALGESDIAFRNIVKEMEFVKDSRHFLGEHNSAVVVLNMKSIRTRMLLALYIQAYHRTDEIGNSKTKRQRDQPSLLVAMQAMAEEFTPNDGRPAEILNDSVRAVIDRHKLGFIQHADLDFSLVCPGKTSTCGQSSSCVIVHKDGDLYKTDAKWGDTLSTKKEDGGEEKEEVPSSETVTDFDTGRNITKADLPIYLLQPDTDQTVQIKWGKLAQMWNRTIQYEDIVQQSTLVSSLPLPSSNLRRVVMLHTAPKMGSSTIREACSVNYEKTCDIPYKAVNMKPYHGQSINRPPRPIPLGQHDGKTLYPMIRKCRSTSHFCIKDIIMPTGIPTYDDVMFVHMFPFRNYNEFAKSALKHRYDVEGNFGCSRVKSLLDECKPGRYELDLRKYSKTQLSRFKEEVVQRMNDRNEHHIFLLYHHRELDSVLDKLSGVYDIPRLPGSNGTRNEVRPKGTCEDSEKLLDMYHDCFSDELMELT